MSDDNLNPVSGLYNNFIKIMSRIVIKYRVEAEKYETMEIKQRADQYLDAYYKKDTFLSYRDYTEEEFINAGLSDYSIILEAKSNIRAVPERYRATLLTNRRKRVISSYEEKNNYYRMLNGLPDEGADPLNFFYVPEDICVAYDINKDIPIHNIQDYYNDLDPGDGDRLIGILEGLNVINTISENNPDVKYLKFIGSNRIPLHISRNAKNFEILALKQGDIKFEVYDEFLIMYEQCRDYFVTVLYNPQFRSIIDFYDNFIAMCIMVMTINQVVTRQLSLSIEREFYDIYAVKMLYDVYGIPYNLSIDDDTQRGIVQNLNILVQNKSTNTVMYDIANLLGFTNLDIYKYFLMKERKYDQFEVPIIKYKKRFNNESGEVETVPDYEAMYNIYFQKVELMDEDIQNAFNSKVNMIDYDVVTDNDPFWLDDEKTYKMMWESNYNFVESKYLGFGISYKLTNILFENILLLKLLMTHKNTINDITLQLPKILDSDSVPLFDAVITLICLVAKKHVLTGEIISIPTQVISVLDYLQNSDSSNDMCVDTFSFNFDYFKSEEGISELKKLKKLLGPEKSKLLDKYLSILTIDSTASNAEKLAALNGMYENIQGFYNFLLYEMTDASDYKVHSCLNNMYRAAFYSREIKSMFTIKGETTGVARTAKNYFEYLYYINPKLYNAIFVFDSAKQYNDYITSNGIDPREYTYSDFRADVEKGTVDGIFDTLVAETGSDDTKVLDDIIYYYVNHIISKIKTIINDLNFITILNDTATPLEELLLKLMRFFKSLTTDIVSLDIIYIYDTKMDNLLRFIDDPHYIRKIIETHDKMNISYADTVSSVTTSFTLNDKSINFKDKIESYAKISIGDRNDNMLNFNDTANVTQKDLLMDDKGKLYDTMETSSTLGVNDSLKLKETVKLWYSE